MTAAHCTNCRRAMDGTSCNDRPWMLDGLPVDATRYGSEAVA